MHVIAGNMAKFKAWQLESGILLHCHVGNFNIYSV